MEEKKGETEPTRNSEKERNFKKEELFSSIHWRVLSHHRGERRQKRSLSLVTEKKKGGSLRRAARNYLPREKGGRKTGKDFHERERMLEKRGMFYILNGKDAVLSALEREGDSISDRRSYHWGKRKGRASIFSISGSNLFLAVY